MEEAEQRAEEVDLRMGVEERGTSPHPVDMPSGMSTPLPREEGDFPSPEAELLEVRRRWLESHRRALLAENAGRVVPELVVGSTVEEMERSLEVARAAFETARQAALAEMAATRIPTGSPVRQGPSPESMSPMEKIAYGLKRD